MEITDAEAQSRGGLESATGGVHADGGRGERVLGRKHQCAPVLSILIRSTRRAGENIVPSMIRGPGQRIQALLGRRRHSLEDIRL